MFSYASILPHLDRQVESLLPRQVMDRSRADYGAFISDGMAAGTSVSSLSAPGYAYLLEGSAFYRSEELVARIRAGAAFARKARRRSGCYDLVTTNFDSAPDTGFLVKAIAPVVKAARKAAASGDGGAKVIAEELGEIVRAATPGMARGGFHTPNHRWVLVAALSQALALFPDLEGRETVESYLAETIDINADGEYTERSTGVYNAVCNRALRIAAEELGRPELLAPVRRNLDLSYHLLHGDGTVVTSISRRQDRGQRTIPIGLADSFYALARTDGNGFYAAVADWLFALSSGGTPWTLHPFLEHPEWRKDDLRREALPETYTKVYPVSGIWRVRKGKVSATTASGITAPFSLTCGCVTMNVKVCASYFAVAQFEASGFESIQDGVWLHDPGRGSVHSSPGYYQPVGRPVTAEDWNRVRRERDHAALPAFAMDLEVKEVPGGFDLRLVAGAYDGVPLQIECDFDPGGEWDFDGGALEAGAGQTFLLKAGRGVYHKGADAISVGPGGCAHRFWQMRGSEGSPEAFRVLVTALTPVDRTLEVRCGTWSPAEERIV